MIILIFALQRFYPRATLYERVWGGGGGEGNEVISLSPRLTWIIYTWHELEN